MTFKRKVLTALTRSDLLEVGRALELDVTTNMRLEDLRDVVAGSKKRGMMEKILPLLSRDTLKTVCEAVGISQEGREKQVLIDRILAAGGEGVRVRIQVRVLGRAEQNVGPADPLAAG